MDRQALENGQICMGFTYDELINLREFMSIHDVDMGEVLYMLSLADTELMVRT